MNEPLTVYDSLWGENLCIGEEGLWQAEFFFSFKGRILTIYT
jgi:hypothetical protein